MNIVTTGSTPVGRTGKKVPIMPVSVCENNHKCSSRKQTNKQTHKRTNERTSKQENNKNDKNNSTTVNCSATMTLFVSFCVVSIIMYFFATFILSADS